METAPTTLGKLHEFTFAAETRPMLCLDPEKLTELQSVAARTRGLFDPVFSLDEATGSIGVVCQLEAMNAPFAAHRGAELFTLMLKQVDLISRSGDILENVSANVYVDDPSYVDGEREDDLYTERGSRT